MFPFCAQLLSFIVSKIRRNRPFIAAAQLWWMALALAIASYASTSHQASANETCFRPAEGSVVSNPPELRSQNGVLEVTLKFRYRQTLIGEGPVRYCYVTDAGETAPTLRVHPGDRLIIHFVNEAPASKYVSSPSTTIHEKQDCTDPGMGFFSTNLHFHGMSIPPVCHQDDVLHTFVQPGQEFDYDVRIPANQPPGLYWYHPHVHGITEGQMQGGASGALIVEGIEKQRSFLAGMPQRIFVIRDQQLTPSLDHAAPSWDLSINYVPILYPTLLPSMVQTNSHVKEFWRVVNAGADTILDLQLLKDGQAQKLQLVALDGVAVQPANSLVEDVPLPPGSRAEFVVQTPNGGDQVQLITKRWDTGPAGDSDPRRPLMQVVSKESAAATPQAAVAISRESRNSGETPWKGSTLERRLYFSESSPNLSDPDISTFFFITVVGKDPERYEMDSPPNIVLHQGAVEAWTIENRSAEDHDFHIHQLHFQVLAIDGTPVHDGEVRDTINVPHWQGDGPYPSVRLLMDFRDPKIVGTFPYHCHIEKHADMGMMGTVEVLPPGVKTSVVLNFSPARPQMRDEVEFTATVVPENSSGKPLTGEVQLNIDGLNLGKMAAISNGQAVLEAFFPEKGEHVVKAMYWGDPAHGESASAPAVVRVR
jgi:FtsP/CotA-like multicopper oxidase with cupredoxin domain